MPYPPPRNRTIPPPMSTGPLPGRPPGNRMPPAPAPQPQPPIGAAPPGPMPSPYPIGGPTPMQGPPGPGPAIMPGFQMPGVPPGYRGEPQNPQGPFQASPQTGLIDRLRRTGGAFGGSPSLRVQGG